MAESDRTRWNARYGSAQQGPPPSGGPPAGEPRRFLVAAERELAALAPGGRALDLACGPGREACWLAERGFVVDAVDIADVGLARAAAAVAEADLEDRVHLVAADLDDGLPAELLGRRYEVIWAGHFRGTVVEQAVRAVAAPGALLVTTRLSVVGRAAAPTGAAGGPDPAFLAAPGELVELAERCGLSVLRHQEGDGEAALLARCP